MHAFGFRHKRMRAVTPSLISIPNKNVTMRVTPHIVQTELEMCCVLSHLLAIYTAVYDDKLDPTNPYALIVEDDVNFEMDVDFAAMADKAPEGFGILQLMTSSSHDVDRLWKVYNETRKQWTRRHWETGYWSTQAYLINKRVVKKFIDQVVVPYPGWSGNTNTDLPHFKIVTPSQKFWACSDTGPACYVPFRIVADIYLYTGCGPTYVSHLPFFNGAITNSTIHHKHFKTHRESFLEIGKVLEDVRQNATILPPFVKPLPERCIKIRKPEDVEIKSEDGK